MMAYPKIIPGRRWWLWLGKQQQLLLSATDYSIYNCGTIAIDFAQQAEESDKGSLWDQSKNGASHQKVGGEKNEDPSRCRPRHWAKGKI